MPSANYPSLHCHSILTFVPHLSPPIVSSQRELAIKWCEKDYCPSLIQLTTQHVEMLPPSPQPRLLRTARHLPPQGRRDLSTHHEDRRRPPPSTAIFFPKTGVTNIVDLPFRRVSSMSSCVKMCSTYSLFFALN